MFSLLHLLGCSFTIIIVIRLCLCLLHVFFLLCLFCLFWLCFCFLLLIICLAVFMFFFFWLFFSLLFFLDIWFVCSSFCLFPLRFSSPSFSSDTSMGILQVWKYHMFLILSWILRFVFLWLDLYKNLRVFIWFLKIALGLSGPASKTCPSHV